MFLACTRPWAQSPVPPPPHTILCYVISVTISFQSFTNNYVYLQAKLNCTAHQSWHLERPEFVPVGSSSVTMICPVQGAEGRPKEDKHKSHTFPNVLLTLRQTNKLAALVK